MTSTRKSLYAWALLSLALVAASPRQGSSGYMEVKDWPRLPADVQLGEVSGVDIDSHGHVFVFNRPGRGFEPTATALLEKPAMIVIDAQSGTLVASWGAKMFLVPHGVTIDRDDNVWVTDVGLQQVMKFSHDGELLLTLGEARVGGWDATHFDQPTDIAVLEDGSFYVSDGYVNSRVAHFDRTGKLLHEWGSKGSDEGLLSTPHGLALGPDGTILVADRENSRVQVFDREGHFKQQWIGAREKGRVFAVATAADGSIFAGVRRADYDPPSNGVLRLDREWHAVSSTGFGAPGDPVFNAVHDLAVGRDGSLYVAETRTKRVVKLRPR
jgi:peptidylamidoglycolate lyase